jgi:hypothetical protein
MIKPYLKVADTLARDYSPDCLKGTRVVYDSIKCDHDFMGGIAVRAVSPFSRPVWLSASWLSSYHRQKGENEPMYKEVFIAYHPTFVDDNMPSKEEGHGKD